MDSISKLGRSPRGGNGNPLQYSCLKNPIDRGAWRATVSGVTGVGHGLATKPPSQKNPCVTEMTLIIFNVEMNISGNFLLIPLQI